MYNLYVYFFIPPSLSMFTFTFCLFLCVSYLRMNVYLLLLHLSVIACTFVHVVCMFVRFSTVYVYTYTSVKANVCMRVHQMVPTYLCVFVFLCPNILCVSLSLSVCPLFCARLYVCLCLSVWLCWEGRTSFRMFL